MKPLIPTLIVAASLHASGLQPADPIAGIWQINHQKSTGYPPQVSMFDRDRDHLRYTAGSVCYLFKLDGLPHSANASDFDTAIWRQTGSRRFVYETSKRGKRVSTVITDVAADNRTRTYRQTRKLANGVVSVSEGIEERIGGLLDPAVPLIGHWRLRSTIRWTQTGNQLEYRSDSLTFRAPVNGRDYPVTPATIISTVALQRIGSSTIEVIGKKDGTIVSTQLFTVSPDGRTLTQKCARGTAVFDRIQ